MTRKSLIAALVIFMMAGMVLTPGTPRAEDKKEPVKSETAKPEAVKSEAAKAEKEKADTTAKPAADAPKTAWQVRCEDLKKEEKVVGQYCEMFQNISVTKKDADPSTAQRVIEFAIGYPPSAEGKRSALVIMPLGILVNQKIDVEVDGDKKFDFNITFCDVNGCFAMLDLSDKNIDTLSKGKEMTIKAKAATGQDVKISLSLAGFGPAHDKVKPKKGE